MCEVTNGKIYVADEDIICYKTVKNSGLPGAYRPAVNVSNFCYIEGVRYVEGGFNITGSDEVRECWVRNGADSHIEGRGMWFHNVYKVGNLEYFREYFTKDEWVFEDRETDYCMTNKGFYSYTHFMNGRVTSDVFRNCGWIPCVVARCIIPKGARYCVSDDGEVFVSDEIVFDKVLDTNKQKTGYESLRFEY